METAVRDCNIVYDASMLEFPIMDSALVLTVLIGSHGLAETHRLTLLIVFIIGMLEPTLE